MKKKIFVLMILLLSVPVLFAQEETLVSGKVTNGGFGGPVVKFTSINSHFGVLVGGQGGWIINHTFAIGGGGYGLANNIKTDKIILGEQQLLNLGYGGVELHYIHNSEKLIHCTVSLLIGAGAVSYRHPNNWEGSWDTNVKTFFALEPTVRVMLNVTSFFRVGIGGGYRLLTGANLDNLKSSDISGPSAEVVFKFGKF